LYTPHKLLDKFPHETNGHELDEMVPNKWNNAMVKAIILLHILIIFI